MIQSSIGYDAEVLVLSLRNTRMHAASCQNINIVNFVIKILKQTLHFKGSYKQYLQGKIENK